MKHVASQFTVYGSLSSLNLLIIFISVINQLDAQTFCFTISLFHASTCFEHMCSSSGQNCIIHPLVSPHSVGGRPVHRLREDRFVH